MVGHHNASCDYYHDDHEDTKQCLRGWETTQLGSHADWWMEDSITGQQQPSGIKVHHCNDWWWLRVADRKVTLIVIDMERRPAEQCRLAAMH